MSPDELQMIFHVDSVDLVPNYEVVQLLHHDNNHLEPPSNLRKYTELHQSRQHPYSYPNLNPRTHQEYPQPPQRTEASKQYQYHRRRKRSLPPPSSQRDGSQPFDQSVGERDAYNELDREPFEEPSDLQNSVYDVSDIKEHRVSFHVFGHNVNLTLRPTRGLFKSAIHKLPMWFVHAEANATNGLKIQKIVDEVSVVCSLFPNNYQHTIRITCL